MKISNIFISAFLGFYCSVAVADNRNLELKLTPNYNFDESNITILGIVLDSSFSINDIENILGTAPIYNDMKDVDVQKVCYKSKIDDAALVLLSQWGQITDIWLYRSAKNLNFYNKCKPSKIINESISTKSGISLNLSLEEIYKLGVEMKMSGDVISYQYNFRKSKAQVDEKIIGSRYDVISVKFEFTLAGKSIDKLWISKSTQEW